jgi:hypothetical protein
MVEAAAGEFELKSEALGRIEDLPEDLRKRLAALGDRFPTREKFEERLAAVLSPDETAKYGARITRAAEPAVIDAQLRKVDLLGLAAVWIWGVLPAAVLAAALWVGVVRRQE